MFQGELEQKDPHIKKGVVTLMMMKRDGGVVVPDPHSSPRGTDSTRYMGTSLSEIARNQLRAPCTLG